MKNIITIDCETESIQTRPDYPPKIIGVSIKYGNKEPKYYGFGHVNGLNHAIQNNSTFKECREAVQKAYDSKLCLLFQNAKFDVDCIETHLNLPIPNWDRIHDTMFLLFLDDPFADSLSLKPSAERLLGMPPDERDVVGNWLVEHQPVRGTKISRSSSSLHYYMGYLKYAPFDLVGSYCNRDTLMTYKLFQLLYPSIVKRGMLSAYDRERELMPILLGMERRGIRIDVEGLTKDVASYRNWKDMLDQWLYKRLGPGVNIDSGLELSKALIDKGLIDLELAPLTPTGRIKTSKDALNECIKDKQLTAVLKYRSQVSTCLSTFMEPWLKTSEKGGKIYTNWNQVKGATYGGTRTGRLSSSPNFQNMPTTFDQIFWEKKGDKQPKKPFKELPPLPQCRKYIVANPGKMLIRADYSGQELRMLAHFENGTIRDLYNRQADVDLHQHAVDMIAATTGLQIIRRDAKTISFSILYGAGIGKLASSLECSTDKSKQLKNAYMKAFPGIEKLQKVLKDRAKLLQPFRTLGGREYFCEAPKIVNGHRTTFEYKMLNHLIQGSAADMIKAAMIAIHNAGLTMVLSVHDEIVIETSRKSDEKILEKSMVTNTGLDVPVLVETKIGYKFGDLK